MREFTMMSGDFAPHRPVLVADVNQERGFRTITETVNLIDGVKDAAGSTLVIDFKNGPILDASGAHVGSFWGLQHNLQYEAAGQAFVETNGSAAVAIYDAVTDLEKIFEGNAAARYVMSVKDGAGVTVTGFIGGVAVSSGVYTFSVYSEPTLANQNWVEGGSTAFDATKGVSIKIYKYTSSFSWGGTDTFNKEVPYMPPENIKHEGKTEFAILASLANGEYALDYVNSRAFVRKADADDTETATYKTKGQSKRSPSILTQSTTILGVAKALSATPLFVNYVDIQAAFGNAASVFIGGSSLDAGTPTTGIELIPGASVRLDNVDLSEIYMDVTSNDDDVIAMYYR